MRKPFIYQVGEHVKTKTGEVTITGLITPKEAPWNGSKKGYHYKCNRCPHTGAIREEKLKVGQGCSACANNKTIIGVNDIATTAPWMIEWFENKEDAKRFTAKSNEMARFKCVDCDFTKEMQVYSFFSNGLSCPRCSLKRGYPETMLINVLTELQISHETRVTFDWSQKRQYDFYIPTLNMVIETHGLQHYEDSYGVFKRTVRDEQENDSLKEALANNNGISQYIVLDCRKSELEWIKSSIMSSELPELLEFTEDDVDWIGCHSRSINTNIAQEVANQWNEGCSVSNIASHFDLSTATIRKHLINSAMLGWCDYDATNERKKAGSRSGKLGSKRVTYHNPKNNHTQTFDSIKECCEELKKLYNKNFNDSAISRVCKGKLPHYRGMNFNYTE